MEQMAKTSTVSVLLTAPHPLAWFVCFCQRGLRDVDGYTMLTVITRYSAKD